MIKGAIAGQIVFQERGVSHPERRELAPDEGPIQAYVSESGAGPGKPTIQIHRKIKLGSGEEAHFISPLN